MIEAILIVLIALLGAVLVVLAMAPFVVAGILVESYALHVLWGWFIVPLFHLPALSWAAAAGVRLVALSVVPRYTTPTKEEAPGKKDWRKSLKKVGPSLIGGYLAPFLAILVGWVVKTYFIGAP